MIARVASDREIRTGTLPQNVTAVTSGTVAESRAYKLRRLLQRGNILTAEIDPAKRDKTFWFSARQADNLEYDV